MYRNLLQLLCTRLSPLLMCSGLFSHNHDTLVVDVIFLTCRLMGTVLLCLVQEEFVFAAVSPFLFFALEDMSLEHELPCSVS